VSTILVKPVGDRCNLACRYCFYHPATGSPNAVMSDRVLAAMIEGFLAEGSSPTVFAWQGGEPTLAGIDFYRKALAEQRRHAASRQRVVNTFQTNGVVIDDQWAAFLAQEEFLVGLSIDGPPQLHDEMRRARDGAGSHERAVKAWRALRRRRAAVNILSVVSAANQESPADVYAHLTTDFGADYIQFIPCVEWTEKGTPTPFSLRPGQYGRFLVAIFDLWSAETQRAISVKLLDDVVLFLAGKPMRDCMHRADCDSHLVVERDGSVYPCDFFVRREHRLGTIMEHSAAELRATPQARAFRERKARQAPAECAHCSHFDICRGGCCKFWRPGVSGPAEQYLCEDMRYFLDQRRPQLEQMAAAVRARWRQHGGTIDL
jgi:uncharacterized protein